MNAPVKAPKTRQNQPQPFKEAMAATQAVPVSAPSLRLPRLTLSQFRTGLVIVWALATITAGIGLGLLLRNGRPSPTSDVPPIPVAQASLRVANSASGTQIQQPAAPADQILTHVQPVSVTQAQAGNPVASLSAATFQPAGTPDALQPGYQSTGMHAQGQLGTQPVR